MVEKIVRWIDEGKLVSHMTVGLKLNRAGLTEAHRRIEAGGSIGKIGLSIYEDGEGGPYA